MADVTVSLEGKVVALTDAAVLVKCNGEAEPRWLPLSLIETDDDIERGAEISFEIPKWLAEREGLE
jgi:hypothetical protein